MPSPYEIQILPSNIMCVDCKGIGMLGGSLYVTESCAVCKGTGMIKMEVERCD